MAGSPVHHHSHQSVMVAGAQKRFTPGCVAQTDNCSAATTVAVSQQPYSGYTGGASYGGATPTGGDNTGVYQQPYYVYTSPYSTMHIQQQYEGRMVNIFFFIEYFFFLFDVSKLINFHLLLYIRI